MSSMSPNNLPKLVVFDLDYTLWPFWVDTHVSLPVSKRNDGCIYDRLGAKVESYPESTKVLQHLKELGCDIGVASRTHEVKGAQQLVHLFGWEPFFKYKEIYPGCKKTHFQSIKKSSNINYEDMIFFDDEQRNIKDLREYNVTCILVRDGMNMAVLEEGLKAFREARR